MTKTLLTLVGLSFLALTTCDVRSQTAPPTNSIPSPQTFLQSAESYFSSFNTNSTTFGTNAPYEMWTGAAYQSGLNVGAQVGFEARPFANWPAFTLGSVSTMAGIADTFASQELDTGVTFHHYDVEFGAGVGGQYDFTSSTIRPAAYAEIKKATTANTFLGIRIAGVFAGNKPSQPVVTAFVGFTF